MMDKKPTDKAAEEAEAEADGDAQKQAAIENAKQQAAQKTEEEVKNLNLGLEQKDPDSATSVSAELYKQTEKLEKDIKSTEAKINKIEEDCKKRMRTITGKHYGKDQQCTAATTEMREDVQEKRRKVEEAKRNIEDHNKRVCAETGDTQACGKVMRFSDINLNENAFDGQAIAPGTVVGSSSLTPEEKIEVLDTQIATLEAQQQALESGDIRNPYHPLYSYTATSDYHADSSSDDCLVNPSSCNGANDPNQYIMDSGRETQPQRNSFEQFFYDYIGGSDNIDDDQPYQALNNRAEEELYYSGGDAEGYSDYSDQSRRIASIESYDDSKKAPPLPGRRPNDLADTRTPVVDDSRKVNAGGPVAVKKNDSVNSASNGNSQENQSGSGQQQAQNQGQSGGAGGFGGGAGGAGGGFGGGAGGQALATNNSGLNQLNNNIGSFQSQSSKTAAGRRNGKKIQIKPPPGRKFRTGNELRGAEKENPEKGDERGTQKRQVASFQGANPQAYRGSPQQLAQAIEKRKKKLIEEKKKQEEEFKKYTKDEGFFGGLFKRARSYLGGKKKPLRFANKRLKTKKHKKEKGIPVAMLERLKNKMLQQRGLQGRRGLASVNPGVTDRNTSIFRSMCVSYHLFQDSNRIRTGRTGCPRK